MQEDVNVTTEVEMVRNSMIGQRRSTPFASEHHNAVRATFRIPVFLFFLVFVPALSLSQSTGQTTPDASIQPQPQAQIDLAAAGYRGLSANARLARQSNLSLDFLDSTHILLTFNPKKMFTRLPDCPPNHDDRIIHAVILELPSGHIVKEADWYLHDHQRYLWPLGSGRMLLRKLNSLYLLDSDFHEKLLLASPKAFLWITVTADNKQIIVEREQDSQPTPKRNEQSKTAKPKVVIEFLDEETLAVQRVIKSEGAVNLEAMSSGFSDVIHNMSGKVWLVRFGPTSAQREYVTRVRTHCVPDVMFSSGNTLLVGRCAMNGSDYSVSSFTLTGHFLWRQHWAQRRYAPKLQRSEDGSRFVVSSISRVITADVPASPLIGTVDSEEDLDQHLRQNIEVLDTATGSQAISLTVAPAELTAQNLALSTDGKHLAVLQGTVLALYELPVMSEEDRARYEAAKGDTPGLYPPVVPGGHGAPVEETTFTAVDAAEESSADEKPPAATILAKQPTSAATQTPVTDPGSSTQVLASAPATETPAITVKANSRVVVEEVVVTDAKGHPVKGLRQQDFQLTEDSKPQNLRFFEELPGKEADSVQGNASPAATSVAAKAETQPARTMPKLPPNIYTNNIAVGPETGSSTIVVLDLLNTPLPDQERARDQLVSFIKKRPEASQMALCSLTSSLRLIQGFTRDENALIGAVHGKKGGVKAPPWQSDAGLEKSVQLARDLAMVAGTSETLLALQRTQNALDQQNAGDLDVRMRATLDAFTQLARYLSGIPGRKNLVWLSGSFPLNIFPNPDVTDYQAVTRNYEGDVKRATNLLAEAHVAVYPVSVKGAVTQTMFAASNNGTYDPVGMPGANGPSNPGTNLILNNSANQPLSSRMQRETREFRESDAAEHTTMDQVAAETGGKAFYNSNGIEGAIESAIAEGSHYYNLSYTPANKSYHGEFRKIKILLPQKDYRLSYRHGYYAEDPDEGLKDTRGPAQRVGIAAMQQGSPQSRQIVFSTRVVPIGKPKKVDAGQAALAAKPAKKKNGAQGPVEMQHFGIDYAVDPSDLRFGLTPSGQYHAVLGFMVTAFNDDGRLVASLVSTTTSDLKPASYKDVMAGGFRLHQELDIPVEAVSLRLGVEDGASSHVGTMEIALPVPVPPATPQVATRTLPPIEPD
jgi:VWFA-related protein